MKTSQRGIDFIKGFEGFSPTVYKCPAGLDTVGYGHVVRAGEKFLTLDIKQADTLLANDLVTYEVAVLDMVDVDMTQGQFDALVSFAYNCGIQALRGSTLMRMFNNKAPLDQVANQFLRWNKIAGVPSAGLLRRRAAESDMFLGDAV
jgi:lysozyme